VFDMMTRDAGHVDMDGLMTALQNRATLLRTWETYLETCPLVLCPVSGALPFDQQRDVASAADFEQIFEDQLTQRALPGLGLPGLCVATGQARERPVGVQLVAGRYREDILLSAGAVLEAACGAPQVCDPA
jgi:amidase